MNLLVVALILILLLTLSALPLFVSIAGLSLVCLFSSDLDPIVMQTILIEMNRLATMPELVAVPLFTMVGCMLTASGAPQRMMTFLDAVAGWMPGGSATAALAACAVFSALNGASGVALMAMGAVLYPILQQQYEQKFSLGMLATGSSLGLLFPPSLPIILYGVVAQIDITTIFKSAFLPGVLLLVVLSGYAFFTGIRSPRRKIPDQPFSWRQAAKHFIAGGWDWLMLALILIGVYGKFVTIVEVSAIVLVYVIVVYCFILKEIHWRRLLSEIMIESAILTGAIIIILGMALGLTGYLVDDEVPNRIWNLLNHWTDNKYVFLIGLNFFLIAVGSIIDIFSAIFILVPIIVPVAQNYGIDLYHLAVIILVNLEIGYATPLVGMNPFVSSLNFRQPVTIRYRASIPYILILLTCLVVVTYWPALSLFLIR